MRRVFGLLTLQEPIVIETPVVLSAYSTAHKGFFVENFKPQTFFPARYNGQSYAVVPQDIMDKQWLSVQDPAIADAIDKAAARSEGRELLMTVFLLPGYADKSAPATLDDEDYWLIAAHVKKMMLYPKDGTTLLWQSDDASFKDQKHQELLKLYQ